MKCATEMIAEAKLNKARLEEMEKIKEQERRLEIKKDTNAFCEIIANDLEKLVMKGKMPVYSFVILDNYVMKSVYSQYADRRESWFYTTKIDLQLIINWFETYCFKTSVEEKMLWIYGAGQKKGYKITITPAPICE